jgi:hypothetical protein
MSNPPFDPPPNNAGLSHGSRTGPKRKTLEYERLKFSYDYTSRMFAVENEDSCVMEFSEEEMVELRSALTTFGIGTAGGNSVEYR